MSDEAKEPLNEIPTEAEVEAERDADAAVNHAVAEALPVVEAPKVEEPVAEESVPEPVAAMAVQDEPEPELVAHHVVDRGAPRLLLEKKHPLAIRWMHWINFPVLFTMMWSGLLIYWNDSVPPGDHAHEVYRIGLGHWTLFRFFPDGFYTNRFWDMRFHVTKALGYHFLFMWLFAINGIVYVLYLWWSKEWKFMVPHKESIKEAIQVTLVDLHIRKGMPAQTKYNGAQRIAYSAIVVMGLGSLVSGLAIYRPTQLHWITTLLGGYEMARWEHFWLTIGFSAFFLLHVGQVMLAGWNNFRAMVSGYELRETGLPSIEAERRTF